MNRRDILKGLSALPTVALATESEELPVVDDIIEGVTHAWIYDETGLVYHTPEYWICAEPSGDFLAGQLFYGMEVPPVGAWIRCDGACYDPATFPELHEVIHSSFMQRRYGSRGAVLAQNCVPDLRGEIVRMRPALMT